jgi:hypothetical protein
MDPKRIESPSSPSGFVMEKEYGPFPGEVAYPPMVSPMYGQPFPSAGQPMPQITSYPHVWQIPWDQIHHGYPFFSDDVTKVNVDVDMVDGGKREQGNVETNGYADSRFFPFFGGFPRPYPYPYFRPFYPRPFYGFGFPFGFSPFFW